MLEISVQVGSEEELFGKEVKEIEERDKQFEEWNEDEVDWEVLTAGGVVQGDYALWRAASTWCARRSREERQEIRESKAGELSVYELAVLHGLVRVSVIGSRTWNVFGGRSPQGLKPKGIQ